MNFFSLEITFHRIGLIRVKINISYVKIYISTHLQNLKTSRYQTLPKSKTNCGTFKLYFSIEGFSHNKTDYKKYFQYVRNRRRRRGIYSEFCCLKQNFPSPSVVVVLRPHLRRPEVPPLARGTSGAQTV